MNGSDQSEYGPDQGELGSETADPLDEIGQSVNAGQSAHARPRVAVRTGARLHFGLLDTVAPFGGAGVMIQQPATEVVVTPASTFQCDPSVSDRAPRILDRIVKRFGLTGRPTCQISAHRRAGAHTGLGSGTQLSLAIAEALCRHIGCQVSELEIGCQLAGRGKRSAVGVHGYFRGGLIYESGEPGCRLNPVRQRVVLPAAWRIGYFVPRKAAASVSGELEGEKFSQLGSSAGRRRADLNQILVERLLPAAQGGDFDAFAAAVQAYNRLSGLLFAEVQGGPYNGPEVTELIETLRDYGATGVGQSSWGPGVFTWFASSESACRFMRGLPTSLAGQGMLTPVLNVPRQITIGDSPHS